MYFTYKSQVFRYFNDFSQLLWTSSQKYKILLTRVIEMQNIVRTHCEAINQSISQSINQSVSQSVSQSTSQPINKLINQYSFNKQKKHRRISKLFIDTVSL